MGRYPVVTLCSPRRLLPFLAGMLALVTTSSTACSQTKSLEDLVSAVVQVKAYIEADGTTVDTLGREREGSGIVIDNEGLVLTIGYLMVEARAAEIRTNHGRTVPAMVVGYDHETGFGLLRALVPLQVPAMSLGKSAEAKAGEPALVASFGGASMVAPVHIAAKREFAGSWEYLLDEAIFTTPPHPAWSGAALINRDGKLVGVGSLVVGEVGGGAKGPGNMFVPIDLLPPIMGELLANGRTPGPGHPWLGVTANEVNDELLVARVTAGSPAARAGVQAGATILEVNGERPKNLTDFYRKVWARGGAGVVITLDLSHNGEVRRVEIMSTDRRDHLKLKSSL
jgi:S1-C subfamily serine protease